MNKILLTQHKITLVDDKDYFLLIKFLWHYKSSDKTGYARHCVYSNGKVKWLWMHRFILQAPNELEVDHIDGNGLNNQKYNLRLATHSQNMSNSKLRKNCTSEYKGVYYNKTAQKWQAQI